MAEDWGWGYEVQTGWYDGKCRSCGGRRWMAPEDNEVCQRCQQKSAERVNVYKQPVPPLGRVIHGSPTKTEVDKDDQPRPEDFGLYMVPGKGLVRKLPASGRRWTSQAKRTEQNRLRIARRRWDKEHPGEPYPEEIAPRPKAAPPKPIRLKPEKVRDGDLPGID